MFSKSNDARDKHASRQPGQQRNHGHRIKIFGGLAAGFVGGVVATWALDKYQQGALEVTRRAESAVGAGPVLSRHQEEQIRAQQQSHSETAERLVKSTRGKGLSRAQRREAVPIVHYAVGALAGSAYGLAAEIFPAVRAGYGTGYASLLFMGKSQALIPGFGFGPWKNKISAQGDGLSGHLIYGAVLESTRRLLRRLL